MKIRPGPVQIFVSDIEKARKWYSENMGMKVVDEYPDLKCILMRLDKTEFDIGVPNPRWGSGWDKVKSGGRTPIFFETPNIKQIVKEMKNRGVVFLEEPRMTAWGEIKAVFADPDGNEFSLIQVK